MAPAANPAYVASERRCASISAATDAAVGGAWRRRGPLRHEAERAIGSLGQRLPGRRPPLWLQEGLLVV